MTNFKISYYNIDLDSIQKKLSNNQKKISEINKSLSDLESLKISNKTNDLNNIKNITKELIKKKILLLFLELVDQV